MSLRAGACKLSVHLKPKYCNKYMVKMFHLCPANKVIRKLNPCKNTDRVARLARWPMRRLGSFFNLHGARIVMGKLCFHTELSGFFAFVV